MMGAGKSSSSPRKNAVASRGGCEMCSTPMLAAMRSFSGTSVTSMVPWKPPLSIFTEPLPMIAEGMFTLTPEGRIMGELEPSSGIFTWNLSTVTIPKSALISRSSSTVSGLKRAMRAAATFSRFPRGSGRLNSDGSLRSSE